MFEACRRFDGIFKRLRGRGHLREEDVDEVLRGDPACLLEATSTSGRAHMQARIASAPWVE